jgi:hypothetical protein
MALLKRHGNAGATAAIEGGEWGTKDQPSNPSTPRGATLGRHLPFPG